MRPTYEVADVINAFYDEAFRRRIPLHHQRTLNALRACRTAALGGHLDACQECGFVRISYNSCRNRHCPKCQGLQKEMWIIQREEELLPVAYFHVVFTLPHSPYRRSGNSTVYACTTPDSCMICFSSQLVCAQ